MQTELLSKIEELKNAITILIGTSDLPAPEKFSKEALDKAAKQFQKLSIERGDWVYNGNIDKYIKGAHYQAGAFIIREFKFTNYFKRGRTIFFNKKSLIALSKELKDRNIDFGRYMEYVGDQSKFKKYIANSAENNKANKNKKPFHISPDVKNITTSPIKFPSPEIIREDIKGLKEEFFQHNLSDYIDIYNGHYAMMKSIYYFEKYLSMD